MPPKFPLQPVLDFRKVLVDRLEVELVLENPQDLLYSQKWGYENTAYEESGLLLGGVFSLPGFPPKVLQKPALEGRNTSTDDSGAGVAARPTMVIGPE